MTIGRFERMVAIPEDEYQHLRSLRQTTDPVQNKFLSLSSDYKKQSFIPDPQIRIQQQSETLNEMVKIKNELKKRVLEATPKPYQSRAQSLFQFLIDKIGINEKGEMKDKEGNVIGGSNVGDLIQHAVRDRRRNIIPVGWKEFLNVLRENNAPQMILNYNTLDEMKPETSKSSSSLSARSSLPTIKEEPDVEKNLSKSNIKTIKTSLLKKVSPRRSARNRKPKTEPSDDIYLPSKHAKKKYF